MCCYLKSCCQNIFNLNFKPLFEDVKAEFPECRIGFDAQIFEMKANITRIR